MIILVDLFIGYFMNVLDEEEMFNLVLLYDVCRYGFVYGGKFVCFLKIIFESILLIKIKSEYYFDF